MIIQKLETPRQIPKCDAETQREQRLLEKQRQKSHSTQRHHKPSICKKKKKKMPRRFWKRSRVKLHEPPACVPAVSSQAGTDSSMEWTCLWFSEERHTGGKLSTLQVLRYVFSVLTPDIFCPGSDFQAGKSLSFKMLEVLLYSPRRGWRLKLPQL